MSWLTHHWDCEVSGSPDRVGALVWARGLEPVMKTALVMALLLLPTVAVAQTDNIALRSVTDFGVSPNNADNTTQMNNAISWAEANYAHIVVPVHIKIAGTLLINQELGQRGFGIQGPGIIEETGSNLPIIEFTGDHSQQAPDLNNLNLRYSQGQGASQSNSYCILFTSSGAPSVYNGTFSKIQCTNAYRGFGQKGGYALWGNRWTSIDCKANSGMCMDFQETKGNQPNNYFGNLYAFRGHGVACTDPFEFSFSSQSALTLENVEGNAVNCNLLLIQNSRVVNINNIRCEVCTIGPGGAYQGMITVTGVGVHIRGYELQTLTLNTGAPYFMFRDAGAYGPPDKIENAVITNPEGTNGLLYAIDSAHVKVLTEPIWNVLGGVPYPQEAYPYDETASNVIDITD